MFHVPLAIVVLCLAGCATQQYWVRPATNIQQTAKDLSDCRMATTKENSQQVYTAQELESPCMVAKGYGLSDQPPAP